MTLGARSSSRWSGLACRVARATWIAGHGAHSTVRPGIAKWDFVEPMLRTVARGPCLRGGPPIRTEGRHRAFSL